MAKTPHIDIYCPKCGKKIPAFRDRKGCGLEYTFECLHCGLCDSVELGDVRVVDPPAEQPKADYKQTAAYSLGYQAYADGLQSADNPNPSNRGASADRIAWFHGWYDRKHEAMFGSEGAK